MGGRRLDETRSAERYATTLIGLLFAYPLFWALGLAGFFVILTALPSMGYLLRAKATLESRIALTLAAALVLCVPIGVIFFGFDLSRVVSVLGNVSVWITLAAGLDAAAKVQMRRRLAQALTAIAIVQGTLTLAAVALNPTRIPLPLLSNVAYLLPSGPASFAQSRLIYDGWLGGVSLRSAGLMSNPTWAGAFAALALIVAATYLLSEKKHRLFWAAGIAFSAVSLYYSLSRSASVLLFFALLAAVLMVVKAWRTGAFVAISAILLPLVAAFLLIGSDDIAEAISESNEDRAGSAVSRGQIYETTWRYIASLGIPILGFGIKPKEEGLVASVGTHSTYLGLLFRAGILGILLLSALVVLLARQSLRESNAIGAGVLVFLLGWMALGDIDAGHLAPLFLIFCVGQRLSKQEVLQ